jgi:hypothetical protein
VQFAVECKEAAEDAYDETWCVMDVEQADSLDAIRVALALLEKHQIRPVLSNPAFEVWLLAHFEKTGAGFLNGNAVAAQLSKHWKIQFSIDYDKADE